MGSVRLTKSLVLSSCYFGGTLGFLCSAGLGCSAEDATNNPGTTQGSPTSMGSPTSSNNTAVTGAATTFGNGPTTGTNTNNGTVGTTGTGVAGPTGNAGPTTTSTGFGPVTSMGSSGVGGATSSVTGGTPSTTGVSGDCGITVDTYTVSEAISTVGMVTWSATSAITSATIEFGLPGGPTMSAPVDLAEPGYRTLLLGMKGDSSYEFQIVADAGGTTCTSEKLAIQTGSVPNNVPLVDRSEPMSGATTDGFIITSAGLGGFGGPGGGGGAAPAYIFDMDGDPVWWAESPASCSRAMMDWEGKNMWMVELNVDGQGGEMRRVSMDGTDVQNAVEGLNNTHHDFTVLPGGVIASVSWTAGAESASNLIERSPDGTIKTVVKLDAAIYAASGPGFHANSILYHPADDSYTISDRYPNVYVKLTRAGQLVWQFGGSNPVGDFISGGTWQVNHGHHLLDDGTLLIFNNGMGGQSPVIGYQLNAESSKTADEVFRYSGGSSAVLGDVQRLPNGNTLVTYSVSGIIQEVTPQSTVVQSYTTDSLGYSMWRPTLYGPPPK